MTLAQHALHCRSATFLSRLTSVLRLGDSFLLGADLVKSSDILVPAYDDAAGVTAASGHRPGRRARTGTVLRPW